MTEISYDSLRKIQMQERNFGALSALEDDFYEKYNLWVAEQKRLLQKEFNIESLKAYENSRKILEEISAKREQKIVLKALKDLKGNSVDSSGLSREEKEFYLKLLANARDFEGAVMQFGERKELKGPDERAQASLMTLKMLVAMGKFVAPDGTTYGPYEPEQVVSVERGIGEILLKKGAAEKTDVMEGIEKIDLGARNGNGGSEPAAGKGGLPDTAVIG